MKAENESKQSGLSRRSFLRGSIATVAVAVPALAMADTKKAAAADAKPAAEKPKYKSLLVFRKNCTGCNSCAYACSLYHEGYVRPAVARIYVRRVKGIVDIPNICWHCSDSPCVEACPVTPEKAIYKDKESNVIKYRDEKLCLGSKCNKCVEACPPHYLRVHPETDKPMFCDLCGGDPECVKACTRQYRETGEILRADMQVGGVHRSFRDVTPEEAEAGLIKSLFYPNVEGERR